MAEPVSTVERTLDILLCFNQLEPVLSLTQIAERVNLPKSTVHRHLATLENKKFIARNLNTGLYSLGFRFIEMAALVLQENGFQQWTQPHLDRLSAEHGETVDLSILDGEHVVYLQVVESLQPVKISVAVGQSLPIYCTASGKAFLAYLPDDQVRQLLDKNLIKYTAYTRILPDEIHKDLRATRERGFAISEQEYEKDINAVAAPILDPSGYPVATIAVAGPSYRLSQEVMERVGKSIQREAALIAHESSFTAFAERIARPVPLGYLKK